MAEHLMDDSSMESKEGQSSIQRDSLLRFIQECNVDSMKSC